MPIGRQSREATRFRTRSWRDPLAALDQGRRSLLWVNRRHPFSALMSGLAGSGRSRLPTPPRGLDDDDGASTLDSVHISPAGAAARGVKTALNTGARTQLRPGLRRKSSVADERNGPSCKPHLAYAKCHRGRGWCDVAAHFFDWEPSSILTKSLDADAFRILTRQTIKRWAQPTARASVFIDDSRRRA